MIKRQDIELARIGSIFAIIWYHADIIGHEIAYSGLVIFLMLSMYLGNQSSSNFAPLIKRRYQRLIVPWIFWFIVYAAINLLMGKSVVPLSSNIVTAVLNGPSIHLWYMPFIFMCLVFFDLLRRFFPPSYLSVLSAVAAIIILLSTPAWRPFSIQVGYPVAQYFHAFAGILFGVFIGGFEKIPKWMSVGLVSIFMLVAIVMFPFTGVGVPYLVGAIVCSLLASKVLANLIAVNLQVVSECTFGIYFIHMIVLRVVKKLDIVAQNELLIPLLVFVISGLVVFSARRIAPSLTKYWS